MICLHLGLVPRVRSHSHCGGVGAAAALVPRPLLCGGRFTGWGIDAPPSMKAASSFAKWAGEGEKGRFEGIRSFATTPRGLFVLALPLARGVEQGYVRVGS